MAALPDTLLIADDLTGAADCAGRLARPGRPVRVVCAGPLPPPTEDHAAVALALDARRAPATEVRRLSREAAIAGIRHGYDIRFVKFDSVLRGHPSALIFGVLSVTGDRLVVVAPAFPAQRRWTRGGSQEIGSAAGGGEGLRRIPIAPVVAGLRRHRLIGLPAVRAGVSALASELRRTVQRGAVLAIVDAEQDRDLETIASAALREGALLAGSAGLAAGLARALGRGRTGEASATRPQSGTTGSASHRLTLVVAGSHHPTTGLQIEQLRGHGVPIVPLLPPGQLADPHEARDPLDHPPTDGETGFTMARPKLQTVEQQALATVLTRSGCAVAIPGDWPSAWRHQGLIGFGRLVAEVIWQLPPIRLVLTGGDTALAVLGALGARSLTIDGEIAPGIPSGAILDGCRPGTPVVLKSGGFGDATTLLQILALD